MQDASSTLDALEAAVLEARSFFGIDPLYALTLRADLGPEGCASIDAGDGYLRCTIRVNLAYYQQNPGKIRRDMAHEVAHLMANEILQLQRFMPDDWKDRGQPAGGMLSDAIETLTVRLECLFMRERP